MGWFKDYIDDGKNIGRYAQVPAYFNFIGLGNKNDKESGNFKTWKKNCKQNLKWFEEHPEKVIGSVDNIPTHKDQAVIFVGMSPNLKRSWKYLKNIDERFVIVATNSSAKYLFDRGIKPNYVIALDGNPGSWTLKLGNQVDGTIGLFSTNVDPAALEDWPGKILVIPYTVGDKRINRKIEERYGLSLPGGGNAVNGATMVFVQKTEACIFLYVGNELSFKNRYYADRKCKHDEEVKFYMKDVNGKKVKTLFPLFEYKIWLENLASQLFGDYAFFNCSEGILGVDTDGSHIRYIKQMPLPDAIEEVKAAFEYEKLPIHERQKIFYEEAYKSGFYFAGTKNSETVWDHVRATFKFKKALDVGCGYGHGVLFSRKEGLDVWGSDLADNREIWEEQGIGEYCISAPAHKMPFQDNEFDFVLCTEVLEHIPKELIINSLREIYRVGSDKFFFTIGLRKDGCPIGSICQSHLTIEPEAWWLDCLNEVGFKHITFATMKKDMPITFEAFSLLVECNKCLQSNVV